MKNASDPYPSPCYGIDIADDGAVVVAERLNGTAAASRYAAGEAGVLALQNYISNHAARPRICIRSCGAAALAVALGLAALPGGEIMLVAPRAIESASRAGREAPVVTPEERAHELARLAGHLY